MAKVYDPQYSTQARFNTPILLEMISEKNIDKLNHWIENAEPHKKMAQSAFLYCITINWCEGLDAIVKANWLSLKSLISIGWDQVVRTHRHQNNEPNLPAEDWLFNKTFKEKVLSKADLNMLSIEVLNTAQYYNCPHYWNVFFNKDVILKGKKGRDLFWTLLYFRYHNEREAKIDNKDRHFPGRFHSEEEVAIRQRYVDDALSVKVQMDFSIIMDILIEERYELFWKVMDANVIIDPKELLILTAMIAIYFRSFRVQVQKAEESIVEEELERILKSLIRFGLTEKVTFKKKDIEDQYSEFFKRNQGYISLRNVTAFNYFGNIYTAYQIPSIEHSYAYHNSLIVDVDIYSGDLFFAKPTKKENTYKLKEYQLLTDKQKTEYRKLMQEKIKQCKK